jgi:hypothetical protein
MDAQSGTMQAAQAALPPGAVFGVPGYTQTLEQYDAITGFSTTLASAAQTAFNPPGSFQKTDVIFWWEMVVNTWNYTYSAAGAIDFEAPYNLFQNLSLKMQGKYLPLEVLSGYDAAIFQLYRPMRGQAAYSTLLGANAFGVYQNANPAGATAFAQANLTNQLPATTTGTGASSFTFTLELPGSIWIDEYWDLAQNGRLQPNAQGVVAPVGAFVSPQYMGGGERVVLPKFNFAAMVAANSDQGPITSGTLTSSTCSIDTRRVGVYGSQNVAELPPVFNWQYRRHSYEYPVGSQTQITIPIQDYGQVMSIWVRIYDPSIPGAYPITNILKCQLLYGSNLLKFDDVPYTMQKRFLDQHGFLPPNGVVIWDMAIKKNNTPIISNAGAINTLTNANVKVFLQTSSGSPPGTTAYAVVGIEYLPFVSQS